MHYVPERVYSGEADEEVCNCLGVLREEIQASILEGAVTVHGVGEACDAGGGCGECHAEIARMLARHLLGKVVSLEGQSPEEAITTTLIPLAKRVGGGVEIESADPWELVLKVDGDEELKQTIALWAEVLIEPLMKDGGYIEVG